MNSVSLIEKNIREILEYIGEDPSREGLLETPKRIRKSWEKLFGGYEQRPDTVLATSFSEGACDEMVILRSIDFFSTCEHHFLPFFGKISIGYIPDGRVVGISKLARLVEVFARRLQIQEKMTTQIAEAIMEYLTPKGCMVIATAQHFCITARGIEKQDAKMVTSAVRGCFKDPSAKQEFLRLAHENCSSY